MKLLLKYLNLLKFSEKNIKRASTVYLFLLGLILTFLVPPFQKPDEVVHYYKAVAIATGTLGCKHDDVGRGYAPIPQYLEEFPRAMQALHIAADPSVKFGSSLYRQAWSQKNYSMTPVSENTGCSLPFVFYFVPAAAIAIPITFGWNPLLIFYIGRFFAFMVSFIMILVALKISPRQFTPMVFLVASFPTVLFQIGSYSKDSLHIAFGLLAISLMFALRTKAIRISVLSMTVFCFVLFMTIFSRPQYILLLLLFLLLPDTKSALLIFLRSLNNLRKSEVILLSIVTAISLAILILLSIFIYFKAYALLQGRSEFTFADPILQIRYVGEYPYHFLRVLNEFFKNGLPLAIHSMIGISGWKLEDFPRYVTVLYLLLSIFVCAKLSTNLRNISKKDVIVLLSIVLGTLIIQLFLMYIFATPVASKNIWGIQGRYFIVLLPLVFILLTKVVLVLRHRLVLIAFLCIFLSSLSAIYERYYNYDHFYYSDNTLTADEITKVKSIQITSKVSQQIRLALGKKLYGLSFYIPNTTTPTKAYKLSLLTSDCKQVLKDTVIDASSLRANSYNDFLITPLVIPSETLCWTLEPFDHLLTGGIHLTLGLDPKRKDIVVSPLYLH